MENNTPTNPKPIEHITKNPLKQAQVWSKTFIGLIMLVGACILVAIFYFFKREELPQNISLDNTPTQIELPQNNQPTPIPSPTPISTPPNLPPLPPLPPQPVVFKNYKNSVLKFSVQIPSNWEVFSETNDEVIFILPDKSRYSVQMYNVPNTNHDFIRSNLIHLTYVQNVSDTIFFNHNALSFNISGIYQNGIALVTNSKLYYVLGNNVLDSHFSQFTITQ